MNRLTEKDEQGNWILKGVKWEQLHEGATITGELWRKLYSAFWKLMEYEDTGLYLSVVSRYIKEAGLGDERYKGKAIPSTGSAPVTAAVYNGGTGKRGN